MRIMPPTRIQVWVEQSLRRCPHPCKHCHHNDHRPVTYLGSFTRWEEVFAVMPRGRRMTIHRTYYSRFMKGRVIAVHFRFRKALR